MTTSPPDGPTLSRALAPTRRVLLGSAGATLLGGRLARAQPAPLTIGVLTDLSGMMIDYSGMGTVTAATMAVEDFGGTVLGRPIQLQRGDHTNPINDFMTHDGSIRADGRVMRDMYILKVKASAESTSEWDLETVVGTIPVAEAFGPPSPACALNKA